MRASLVFRCTVRMRDVPAARSDLGYPQPVFGHCGVDRLRDCPVADCQSDGRPRGPEAAALSLCSCIGFAPTS
ncbi:hypothetical protein CHELA17_61250 [Chelatococcus asaccharovorans]|nr:hypothetical protein CHELA17_61250 [Chelatococcus asaccharovorans]